MRLSSIFTTAAIFAGAGAVSLIAANFSVQAIEAASKTDVLTELDNDGLTWAEVDTNGLQVFLIGTAPDEAARFRALSTAGRVVDAARVIDQMLIEEPEELKPPHFSAEILRNDAGISIIGLVPATTDRALLIEEFQAMVGDAEVTDLLESADFPAPDGWDDAMLYATRALKDLPRSKISVTADSVAIKAMTESEQVRVRLESALMRRKPEDMDLTLDISAPRPVISPFTLRFIIDETGPHFDACSADTPEGRERILKAAADAGMTGKGSCTLGLGTPSRRWPDAVSLAISKLAELGGGSVTFSNADIALVAAEGTNQAVFDRVVGELETTLPDIFALNASLPKTQVETVEGPPEFVATLSPEGAVQLRGRLSSEVARQTADSYARARFGSEDVFTAARVAENLPMDWPVRTLAALEVLSQLVNGAVTVTPDNIAITGKTGNADANAQIAALLASKLGDDVNFEIKVEYEERFDPSLGIPTPEECEARITEVIGARKITFEPGSSRLDASAKDIMDELAEMLKQCGDIPIEIGGHTDSQGRETMNAELSRERAQAVLDALRARQVPVRDYSVKGYGETQPIADNGTEEGREANRRIEFKLLKAEAEAAEQDEPEQEQADPDAEAGEPVATTNDGDAAPADN
ncbi:OmpA family protein [Tropicibacter naphthalenivorans]|uniref:Outer membrane protein ArfA n=1 Tax=Tropicibacter naphthalenivorans TaxID=441103 RepID=A0A0P1G1J4_9RHOB|nr:OmpA family protein [Tropicibacter naphthalenivorans]CUH75512.1 Outer membrane protein ArfA [Tropicibacter naphthalenivorans]SMC44035.1 OmpA-OmpF porin, OOP family [Tropicibacter naphthalenivorans]